MWRLRLLLLVVPAMLAGCEWLETYENEYETYDDAAKAGALGAGTWLPTFLPRSATNIRERHDLDSNESWVRFSFLADDRGAMLSKCKKRQLEQMKFPRRTAGTWWPAFLQIGRSTDIEMKIDGLYFCGSKSYLAVIRETKTAYYWRTAN